MRRLAAVAFLGGLCLIASCGGGESETERTVNEALANMDALGSYRMEDSAQNSLYEQNGDEWHQLGPLALNDEIQREEITTDEYMYARSCDPECGDWHRSPTQAPVGVLNGSQVTFPLATVSAVDDWRVAGENVASLHLTGETPLEDATHDNLRRNARARGFSEDEIDDAFEEFGDYPEDPTVDVELWIDRERRLITRIKYSVSTWESPGADATYSAFNEVIIQPPTNFVVDE